MDTTLCDKIDGIGIIGKATGACCYVATVNNVNLVDNSMTVTFDAPPLGLEGEVDLAANSIRYNCGLCYTGGLGSNMPALGFERDDRVLCLVPPNPPPNNDGEYLPENVVVVGHEFAAGVENQKACGQMGRMILNPGADSSGTDGYGSPFLTEVAVDGVTHCELVNPVLSLHLGQFIASGTLNGGADRHLMVYSGSYLGSDILVAARPYLFPNGAAFSGRLELTHVVNDGLFNYGVRVMTIDSTLVDDDYTGDMEITTKVQPSRSIGTSDTISTQLNDLGSQLTAFELHASPLNVAWAGSPVFGYADASGDIYVREMVGIVKYHANYNDVTQAVTYSLGNPANETLYADQDDSVPMKHVNEYYEQWDTTSYPYNHTISDVLRSFLFRWTTLTNGSNTLEVERNVEYSRQRDWEVYTDGKSGAESVSSASTMEYFLNGVSIGKNGYEISKTWDHIYVASPLSYTIEISGTVRQYFLYLIYLDINNGTAVYARAAAVNSLSPTDILSAPTVNVLSTVELCLFHAGGETVLDTLGGVDGGTYEFSSLGPGGVVTPASGRGAYDPLPPAISPLQYPPVMDPPVCGTQPEDTCSWTGVFPSRIVNYTIHGPATYKTEGAKSTVLNGIAGGMVPGSYRKAVWCQRRLAWGMGGGSSSVPLERITLMFNEFAKSDDGNMLYFSIPKLAVFSTASGDNDYIRVLIRGDNVSLNAIQTLEEATGLEHSQAGLRFAPYI